MILRTFWNFLKRFLRRKSFEAKKKNYCIVKNLFFFLNFEAFFPQKSLKTHVRPPIFVDPACILKNDIFEIFEFFIASDKSKLWYLYPSHFLSIGGDALVDTNIDFRWSWSGGENLKIILLGSEGLTKELAEEIEQDNQSHDGSGGSDTETTSQSNALEVIKVEEEYSDSLKEELLRKRPHGCIARVSTFEFCGFFFKFWVWWKIMWPP